MRIAKSVLTAVVTAAALSACSPEPTAPAGPPSALTALPRDLTPQETGVIRASNAFSFALLHRVSAASPTSNVFISPLSASFALAMTMNGAAGSTLDAMYSTLGFDAEPIEDINAGYASLIALLTSLDPAVTTSIANSIWYREGFPVRPSFLDVTRTQFGARVSVLDFSSPSAVQTINDWVRTSTNGKIAAIIDEIDSTDVMFLINAIYFKGSWRERFDPARTASAPFHTAGGVQQEVPLMFEHATLPYATSDGLQVVHLPYGNSAFEMMVLLPPEGTDINAFTAGLTPAAYNGLASGAHEADVDLFLPRFRVEYDRTLNDDLRALGMAQAFIPREADFTRMSPAGDTLFISNVKQKTFVDVNEEGTEAAAATSVGMGVTSVPEQVTVRVDHPFVFILRERFSGTILFIGKIIALPA